MERILITGGSGLVGDKLIPMLQNLGYKCSILSRKATNLSNSDLPVFHWDIENNIIDERALDGVDYIIHLAGANVAAKRWNASYKQEIIDSRVKSSALLNSKLSNTKHNVKAVISASAVGFYGNQGKSLLSENSIVATNYFGKVCATWEASVNNLNKNVRRVALLRIGIVMAKEGGALPPIYNPMKFRIGPVFGNGDQYYSWIHINDLCKMFIYALKNESINGIYNAVAPKPVPYLEIIKSIERAKKISTIKLKAPLWGIKLMLGEFGETLFYSTNVSSKKIQDSGFKFEFNSIDDAIANLIL
jgi:uncharacterized protein (TIGR01777 family)